MSCAMIAPASFVRSLLAAAGLALAAGPALAEADAAAALVKQGDAAAGAGHFTAAVADWSRAAGLYAGAGDACGGARALARRAEGHQALGFHGKALADFEAARRLADGTDKAALKAAIAGGLAGAHFLAGDPMRAEALWRDGLDAGGGVGARNQVNLANLLAAEGRGGEAIVAWREGARRAEAHRDPGLAGTARVNLARHLTSGAHPETARAPLLAAARAFDGLPPGHPKAVGLLAVARQAARLEVRLARSEPALRRLAFDSALAARELAIGLDDARSLSHAEGRLGALYAAAGRHGEAIQMTERALAAGRRVGASDLLYLWQWQLGRLRRDTGALIGAIAAYREAVHHLNLIRDDLTRDYRAGRRSFREVVGPVFVELADLLLRAAPREANAARAETLRADARLAIEALKAAELRDFFRDDCVTALEAKVTGIDRLATGTAALYPVVLADRLELLVSLADGLHQVTVPIGRAALTAEVRAFRQRLEKRTTHQYMAHGRRLYDWIIRPLLPLLESAGVKTLVFVPDAPLRTIPLAALHDGKRFLVERFALAVTPGLRLLDPRPLPRDRLEIMTSGLTEAVQGYPALPHVGAELDALQTLFPGRALRDRGFSAAGIEAELSDTAFGIVHIASHGEFSSDPDKTFILTYDGKLSMDGLERFIKLGRFRDKPVELLTLSACRTAAGDDRAALGLAGIAVKAGARSALATLWFINDSASADLVTDFYRHLKTPGVSKAEAVRRAQRTLLGDRRYRHPSYWAPFLLIGNWL